MNGIPLIFDCVNSRHVLCSVLYSLSRLKDSIAYKGTKWTNGWTLISVRHKHMRLPSAYTMPGCMPTRPPLLQVTSCYATAAVIDGA